MLFGVKSLNRFYYSVHTVDLWLRARLRNGSLTNTHRTLITLRIIYRLFIQIYIKMKSALKLVLFPFFAMGVYGADEVKSVSATEGESVTLNSLTKIQGSDKMEWRLNQTRIFIIRIVNNEISVTDDTNGAYGVRLQPDKPTGDLKITDIKTTDSGQYILKITSTRGSSEKTFNVNVVPKPVTEPVPEPGGLSPVAPKPVPESEPGRLSPGGIAGIVIAVVAAVAGIVGGIYYGYKKKGPML